MLDMMQSLRGIPLDIERYLTGLIFACAQKQNIAVSQSPRLSHRCGMGDKPIFIVSIHDEAGAFVFLPNQRMPLRAVYVFES